MYVLVYLCPRQVRRLVLLQAQVHLVEVHFPSAVQHRHAVAAVSVLELDPIGPTFFFSHRNSGQNSSVSTFSMKTKTKPRLIYVCLVPFPVSQKVSAGFFLKDARAVNIQDARLYMGCPSALSRESPPSGVPAYISRQLRGRHESLLEKCRRRGKVVLLRHRHNKASGEEDPARKSHVVLH